MAMTTMHSESFPGVLSAPNDMQDLVTAMKCLVLKRPPSVAHINTVFSLVFRVTGKSVF